MGAEATTALAIVTLPHAEPDKSRNCEAAVERRASGVAAWGVALVGGHQRRGRTCAGFAVNGDPETLTKSASKRVIDSSSQNRSVLV